MSEANNTQALKATVIGMFSNFLLALIKGTVGILGNSFALIADATESAADIFTSIILWAGLRIAVKAPDKDHPYGHGKAEPLAAAFVSLCLMVIAAVIGIESIHKAMTPHPLPKAFTLWVLVGVVFVKELLFRYVARIGTEHNSVAVKTDAWHHRGDAITSAAAFVGISIALIGGKGYESADDWAALLASFIIIINAYRMFKPALGEIMDAASSDDLIEGIRSTALTVADVYGTEKCNVRKMGLYFYVDLHVEVEGSLTVYKGHEIAHQVKEAILQSNLRFRDVLIHIEPHSPQKS